MINVSSKDNEWIRRRQIRLIQVRKQSDDIAKRLRERIIDEERQRRLEKENELDRKLKIWKIKRLGDLEKMYRDAITDFGTGHKMAIEEPNTNNIILEKQKQNLCVAKKRGETALEHELKEKRRATKEKLIPIQRKLITRQIEDLRSSLVRTLPNKQHCNLLRQASPVKPFNPMLFQDNSENEEPPNKIHSNQEYKVHKTKPKTLKCSSEDQIKISPEKRKTKSKAIKKKLVHPDKPNEHCQVNGKLDANTELSPVPFSPTGEKLWVDLGAIDALTEVENEPKTTSTMTNGVRVKIKSCRKAKESLKGKEKSSVMRRKSPKREKLVECYDYSLRNNCKYKKGVCSVRKDDIQREPDAYELAKQEEEKLRQDKCEKESQMILAQERGNKAIEKEKINKSYNELLAKLEKLSTKEKIIKSYCHIPPAHMYMSDERRQEKTIKKQRMMDSEFERIYCDVMGVNPDPGLQTLLNNGVQNSEISDGDENLVTKLDFERNLKTNSPASNQEKGENKSVSPDTPVEKMTVKQTPSSFHFKRTKVKGCDSKVISQIDDILEKSRKLRQESQRNTRSSECDPVDETSQTTSDKKHDDIHATEDVHSSLQSGSIASELCKLSSSSPYEENRVSDILFDIKKQMEASTFEDLGMGDTRRDFPRINTVAWPVQEMRAKRTNDSFGGRSSSTSYRSLPKQIQPERINSLLRILAQLKEREGHCTVADELIVKLEKLLKSLVKEVEEGNTILSEEECREFKINPRLNYYISKLLDMSRERIANLNVSSDSETSPSRIQNICDDDDDSKRQQNSPTENKYLKVTNEICKNSRMKRAKELERIIRRWKCILEQYLKNCPSANESKSSKNTSTGDFDNQGKYEELTKECSDRINQLSEVLSGVRKDGEKNECTRSKSPKNQKQQQQKPQFIMGYCDDCSCPYKSEIQQDCDCNHLNGNRPVDSSMESLPNVMEELMRKNILTSPFRWSNGNFRSPHGSYYSGLSRDGSIEGKMQTKRCHTFEHAPPKCMNESMYRTRCMQSCRGVCARGHRQFLDEFQEEGNSNRMNVTPAYFPDQGEEFPTKRVTAPQFVLGPVKHCDAAFGTFSPVRRVEDATNESSVLGTLPQRMEEILKKKTTGTAYGWNEFKGFCARRPHSQHQNGRFNLDRACAAERPKSSPVRDASRENIRCRNSCAGTCNRLHSEDVFSPPRMNNYTPEFCPGNMEKLYRRNGTQLWEEINGDKSFASQRYQHSFSDTNEDFHEIPSDIIPEVAAGFVNDRRSTGWFAWNGGNDLDSISCVSTCAGSCALHCNPKYNRTRSSLVKREERIANSSPNMRQRRDGRYSPVESHNRGEEYIDQEETEDERDVPDAFGNVTWAENILRDMAHNECYHSPH